MLPLESNPAGLSEPSPVVPGHRLIRQFDRGGHGDVWLAQSALGTLRAVKVVYRHRFEGPKPYDRELEGVRLFEPISRCHEGLVDVLQVGHNEEEGWFYYVMELADPQEPGAPTYAPRTLQSELRSRGRMTAMECARLGLRLAEALEFMHGHGRVHRDLKPSNVVFVDGVPKLADAGLVARTGATSLVGTDGFIAPEGQGKAPADIYSLGKVLYELATGKDRREFPEPLTGQGEDPEREALAELNQVVVKACDPDPARRYQRATELKEDLLLILAGRSVREVHHLRHRYARLQRVGLVVLLTVIVVGVAFLQQRRQSRQLWELGEANRRQTVRLHVAAGVRAMDAGDLVGALPWFVEALRRDADDPVAAALHRQRLESVRRECPKLVQIGVHAGPINSAELSPDSRRLVTASDDGTAVVWSLETGEKLTPAFHHERGANWAAFSPDGEIVATGGMDGVARLWNSRTGEALSPPLQHGTNVVLVAFNPRGDRLATASWDGTARLFEVPGGRAVSEPLRPGGRVLAVAFSPDGSLLAAGGDAGKLVLWDVGTGREQVGPLEHPGDVRRILFTADGRRLVTACGDGAARVWSLSTGELSAPPMRSSDGGPVRWIALSPDENLLVTAGGLFGTSGEVRIWNIGNGGPVTPVLRFELPVRAAAFSPDGRWIVTGCLDARARIWQADSGHPVGVPFTHRLGVWTTHFLDGGRRLLTSGRDGTWRLWDLTSDAMADPVMEHPGVRILAFSPDGRHLATAGSDGFVRMWDGRDGRPVGAPHSLGGALDALAFSPRGDVLAAGSTHGQAVLLDLPSGEARRPLLDHGSGIYVLAFSPDGSRLVTGGGADLLRVWSVADGTLAGSPIHHPREVGAACFSPDGRWLAVGGGANPTRTYRPPGAVIVWDVAAGTRLLGPLELVGNVGPLRFSPDGRWLVAGPGDAGVTPYSLLAWEIPSGRRLDWPCAHDAGFGDVDFTGDGRLLATAGTDGVVRVWSLAGKVKLVANFRHKRGVTRSRFSPDARQLLTAAGDDAARLWDPTRGEPLGPPLRHLRRVADAAWSPDGGRVATASEDGTVRGTVRLTEVRRTDWPIADLVLLAEVLAGARMDGEGKVEPLAASVWRERWEQLRLRRPSLFETPAAQVAAWHRQQVSDARRSGQPQAAAFHLQRLGGGDRRDLEPQSGRGPR